MTFVVKVIAVVLVGLAFLMPLAATAHCDGENVAECGTTCDCVCHAVPAVMDLGQATGLTAHTTESVRPADALSSGRLLISDIFRPPTSV
jgi:hypothetical protein